MTNIKVYISFEVWILAKVCQKMILIWLKIGYKTMKLEIHWKECFMSCESQIHWDCGVAIYRNYWVKIISYDWNLLVETYQEINQLNIEFRLELLKCHFAANSQQGRVINWLRVLQISKEILAIDEFNVNACVSKKGGIVTLILYSLTPSLSVLSISER